MMPVSTMSTPMDAPPPPPPSPAPAAVPKSGAARGAAKDQDGSADKSLSGGFAQPPADTMDQMDFGKALEQFRASTKSLELSLSNAACDMACRALASMDRSAKVMCELAHPGDEQTRCDDARAKVNDARVRVQHACGECASPPGTAP